MFGHAALYVGGAYQAEAGGRMELHRQIVGAAPDPQREEAQVADEVRGRLLMGSIVAGGPLALGVLPVLMARMGTARPRRVTERPDV
jgi:hypothetical protein